MTQAPNNYIATSEPPPFSAHPPDGGGSFNSGPASFVGLHDDLQHLLDGVLERLFDLLIG
jgi:hypothetical protein